MRCRVWGVSGTDRKTASARLSTCSVSVRRALGSERGRRLVNSTRMPNPWAIRAQTSPSPRIPVVRPARSKTEETSGVGAAPPAAASAAQICRTEARRNAKACSATELPAHRGGRAAVWRSPHPGCPPSSATGRSRGGSRCGAADVRSRGVALVGWLAVAAGAGEQTKQVTVDLVPDDAGKPAAAPPDPGAGAAAAR